MYGQLTTGNQVIDIGKRALVEDVVVGLVLQGVQDW